MKATVVMSVTFDKKVSVANVRELAKHLEGMVGTVGDETITVKKVTVRSVDIPREENRKGG